MKRAIVSYSLVDMKRCGAIDYFGCKRELTSMRKHIMQVLNTNGNLDTDHVNEVEVRYNNVLDALEAFNDLLND